MSGEHGCRVLVDSPEDGCAEERAWVPVALAADETAACQVALEDHAVPEDFEPFVAGRSWHRRKASVPLADGSFVIDGDGLCDGCRGTGKYTCTACGHVHDDDCDDCYGTGRDGHFTEYEPWTGCGPDDEGAVEFWTIEFAEPEVAVDA